MKVKRRTEQVELLLDEADHEESLCQMVSQFLESSSLPFHHLTGLTLPPPPVSPPLPDLDTMSRSMCQSLLINLFVRDKLELHNFSFLSVGQKKARQM